MSSANYDRSVYGVTPPRESEEDEDTNSSIQSDTSNKTDRGAPTNPDPENISDIATLMKARLQYAQLKIATGLSTESLQQVERAFISSPRQPRRPLPSEYPPTPAHSSPHSRKLKRMLLSAMTPIQNSWRKKKRIREQKKNEAIEDEAAARTILMLSSSSKSTPPLTLTPPRSGNSVGSSSISSLEDHRIRHYQQHHQLPAYYGNKVNAPSMYDAVANIPNYDEQSKQIGQSLPRRQPRVITVPEGSLSPPLPPPPPPPPTAVVHSHNQDTGNPHQYYQYNRPLPPPPQYYYRPKPLPMFGRPLAVDPFNSKPIIQNSISSSRDRTPPS